LKRGKLKGKFMATNKVELDILSNAKKVLGELRQMNAELRNVRDNTQKLHATGVSGATKHKSAMAGLALRFVGYNLILNQVMGSQQKLYEYVTESITKFREFQTRIAEVSTIMGVDFQSSISGLKAGVENLSVSFGKNTSDMSKGLYDIMSAAFSADEAIALLASSTKAAIAGLAEVRESVDIFTTVLNTYGMSAYEATWVSDMLFQSVVRGKFQFADLESALGYVVPIAAQAGIQFDELMAALSTTTRHGLHLDMTSRGLAMAIQNIINPSEGAAKAAMKYGIQMNGLTLRMKGLTGFFTELQEKTKEYGKVVMTELIPNIRSLRTVMVLAGEEGLEGLIDDMDKLSMAGGRTEEALSKIMATSGFVSNQITQQWEQTQRDVGEAWDKLALGVQQGITDIVANWQSFLPIIGPIFTAMKAVDEMDYQKWLKGKQIQAGVAPGYIRKDYPTEVMQVYLDLQKDIAKTSEEINRRMLAGEGYEEQYRQLLALQNITADLQEDFNRAFGEPILGGIRNLEELHVTLDEIEIAIGRIKERLSMEISYGWGAYAGTIKGTLNYQYKLLEAEQAHVDVSHDVKMGLADENYQYKVLNSTMQEAIEIVRNHTEVQKKDAEATKILNMEMRKLQLQAAQIQLKGMLRRRGLTRKEERMLKRIQIEQLKLRIEEMKTTQQETEADYSLYLEKKRLIDDYLRAKTEERYQLKYNYDQQLIDLQLLIDNEKLALEELEDGWKDTTDEIAILTQSLVDSLTEILGDPKLAAAFMNIGIDIQNLLNDVKNLGETTTTTTATGGKTITTTSTDEAKTFAKQLLPPMTQKLLGFVGFQRGIRYVPETQPAIVHRGETISPAGQEIGGGIYIESLTIEVKEIADIGSIEKLNALLSQAEGSGLMKRGRTNYKLRIG